MNSNQLKVVEVAQKICNEHTLIYCAGTFYEYSGGCYYPVEEDEVKHWIQAILENSFCRNLVGEIVPFLQANRYIKVGELNKSESLNLKNCMLLPFDEVTHSHDPKFYSTIQLDVHYDPTSQCPLWHQTLEEIFEGDREKIEVLQEFMGLCLIKAHKI